MKALPMTSAALALLMGFSAAAAQDTTQVRTDMSAPVAEGTYELIEVTGSALPVTVEEENECVEEVTAGTLVIRADGEWEIELTETETCGTDVDEDTETEDGEYTVDGTMIDFRPDEDEVEDSDTDELDLDELVSGTLEGETLRVRTRDADTEIIFRKVQG